MNEVQKLALELFSRVNNYAKNIVNGKIIACKKHIWAAKRYLKDFENENYVFDKKELVRFYVWSRQFRHRAGVLKNKIIELTDFQLFIIANLFCWKRKDNGYRRFRKAYIQLARKNAKSQLLSLIASYECFLSDEQAEGNSAHPDTMNLLADHGAALYFSDCPPVPSMQIPPHAVSYTHLLLDFCKMQSLTWAAS